MKSYEFEYPPNYSHEEDSQRENPLADLYIDFKIQNSNVRLQFYLENTKQLYEVSDDNFEDIAIERAKTFGDADGPLGRVYCDKIIKRNVWINPGGLKVIELILHLVDETRMYPARMLHKGPIYAILLHRPNESYWTLFIEPSEEFEMSNQEKETLKKVINTIRLLN